MVGALWTGISGLAGQQTALDNESHNIANVNTVGYKSSRISFADQMYQDKIGKGTKILDAEKLFVQGNLKLTGVAYDMAISGDGFFSVSNARASGTSETFYTRAGNFRMGDNGTLQDAAGNEVQGWGMTAIDPDSDVTTTDPNTKVFTSDYTKLVSSKVISHSKYVETITAKTTDYNNLAKADVSSVFSGDGAKTKAAKIADIEELVTDYSTWLGKLQDDPDGSSASSTAQVSQVKFKGDTFQKEGDQIHIYIDGTKYAQSYVSVTSTVDMDSSGVSDGTIDEDDHLAASRIATYKALADKISQEVPGLVAHMVVDDNSSFEDGDTFTESTKDADVVKGMMQITSLVPGQSFSITEVAEVSGTSVSYGDINDTASATTAVMGSGLGALESSRDALAKAVAGKQRDVYSTTTELSGMKLEDTNFDYTYSLTIYDDELGKNVTVPETTFTMAAATHTSVDDFVTSINANTELNPYIKAANINGNLVIETVDKYSAAEFSGVLTGVTVTDKTNNGAISDVGTTTPDIDFSGDVPGVNEAFELTLSLDNGETKTVIIDDLSAGTSAAFAAELEARLDAEFSPTTFNVTESSDVVTVATTAGTNVINNLTLKQLTLSAASLSAADPIDKNADLSGREGAGAEFIEIINQIDQAGSQGGLQLRLDTLGISDSAFGEFSVDSSGLITMKQDGAEFAIGQVSIALFNNKRGLEPYGDNLLAKTTSSGEPIYNINNERTANIEGKTLELSTADLSESLVNLMVFQRAFEANAKSITTSDQLLNTLINLKR